MRWGKYSYVDLKERCIVRSNSNAVRRSPRGGRILSAPHWVIDVRLKGLSE